MNPPNSSFLSRTFASVLLALAGATGATAAAPAPAPGGAPGLRSLSLDECLTEALQNNRRRPASRFAVAAAEAQHRQALSSYWPQVALQGGYQRMDNSPNFVFPASFMGVPGQTVTTPPSTAILTLPAGVVGPVAVQMPVAVPGQTITTQPQIFPVPEQDVKLLGPDLWSGKIDVKWLVFDGGMRRGLRQQTESLVAAMKQEERRTDLEIADSVRRMYYGSVLARQVRQVGQDTLARMEATLNLTETMYKEGGGKVKKTDWLDNKVMVESIRAMVVMLEKNEAMAQAALANSIGRSWTESIAPSATEIPFSDAGGNLADLVGTAYRFNPDWNKLEAGIRAAEGAVLTARSGYLPKVAVTGELHRRWNDYDAGLATKRNLEGWTLGVGFEMPLFDGNLTRSKVAEMRARLGQLKEQGFLLKEGLGLMIKDHFLGLIAARKAHQATLDAMKAAEENRDLNTRAYQNELVETEKVIRAQLMEALMSAQHYKARYDHLALQSQLSLAVGTEVVRQLQQGP
ncbi:MAG: TolC family protein [Verrucomicrobia bacterium]|nr:TolC family protein [Verrucomicrobiota bacterium]